MLPEHLKHPLEVLYMPHFLFTFYYHVVNVHLDRTSYPISEHPHHHSLVRSLGIF